MCPAHLLLLFAADDARQAAAAEQPAAGSQPYYMKQTIGNACGTIAMLHAIGNNQQRAGIGAVGWEGTCADAPSLQPLVLGLSLAAANQGPHPGGTPLASNKGLSSFQLSTSTVHESLTALKEFWMCSIRQAACLALHAARQQRTNTAALVCLYCCCAEAGSFLERFFAATGSMSAAERGSYLESPPDSAPDIEEAHQVRACGMGGCH